MTQTGMDSPYRDIAHIPLHIFSNKECTQTPSPDLRAYLRYMWTHHKESLEYLWRHTQQYIQYGGCYSIGFEPWLRKLDIDLTKQGH